MNIISILIVSSTAAAAAAAAGGFNDTDQITHLHFFCLYLYIFAAGATLAAREKGGDEIIIIIKREKL